MMTRKHFIHFCAGTAAALSLTMTGILCRTILFFGIGLLTDFRLRIKAFALTHHAFV